MVLCQVRPGAATTFNRLPTDYGKRLPLDKLNGVEHHQWRVPPFFGLEAEPGLHANQQTIGFSKEGDNYYAPF